MIDKIMAFFGYAKIREKQKGIFSDFKELQNSKKDLGKCNWCSRKAEWETCRHGNLCNSCRDRLCGLE